MKSILTIPRTPVDGYVLEFWKSDYDEPHHYRCTYHVNRPYAEVDPEARWGAPLVDCWLIESVMGGGRWMGWKTPIEVINQESALRIKVGRAPQYHRTYREAALVVLAVKRRDLDATECTVRRMRDEIASLKLSLMDGGPV
jgi:hypothetical protein